jgi:hypothetical protein
MFSYPVMDQQQAAWSSGAPYPMTADNPAPVSDPGRGGSFSYPSLGPVEKTAPTAEPVKAQGFSYPSLGENAPETAQTGRSPEKGTSDTPKAESKPAATERAPESKPSEVPIPDLPDWNGMIDNGDFAGAGQAVVDEIKRLGGSPAEIETARNLSALAAQNSTDPAWVKWSRDMLAWVGKLRTQTK